MLTEKETPKASESPPSAELLNSMCEQARAEAGQTKGLWRRVRRAIRYCWLWVLVRAARATWKHALLVLILTLLGVIFIAMQPVEEEPQYGLNHEFAIESPEFLSTIAGATDTPFVTGNKVEILLNGDQFYPAMLAAIEQAQRSITIEAYIYWAGEIGGRFAEALAHKARSGVPVKILLDAVGSSSISDDILNTLQSAGCEVQWYRPVRWYNINRFNNRTHRKSIIIDGHVGFTGGAGIADHWLGNAEDENHWRDTQVRIEGPAVTPLQTGFARNWLETTGELISGSEYYPPHQPAGPLAVQSVLSSPETGSSTMRIMYYLSIVSARKSIYIANPYFIPTDQAIKILVEAKRRGVDVKIMLSGIHNDSATARNNSTRLYGEMLEAGIEIYEYNRTMLHHKYMVCDDVWSTVGTSNFDNRSFALNDENNACVYDAGFAAQWKQIFLNDLAGCDRVEMEKWRNRGISTKIKEFFVSFLKDQA
jgi:cardiolipin synthase